MADTMPIRIPISMDAQQLDNDAAKASASFGRMRSALRSVKTDVTDTGKSFEQLGREQEQLEARKASLSKRLAELSAAYQHGEDAIDRNAEAQAKLASQITSVENQLRKVDVLMEKNQSAQYTHGISELDAEIEKLSRSISTEVAQLQLEGKGKEATARAAQGAAEMAQLQSQRVDALRDALQRASAAEGEGSKIVAELASRYNQAAGELSGLVTEINRSNEALDKQGASATDAIAGIAGTEVSLNRIGDTLTNQVTNKIIDIGKKALETAIETESMEQSFNSVFKKSAEGMRQWSKDLGDSMDISEYKLRAYMTSEEQILQSLGVEADKHGDIIKGAMERMYDMAAMMDADVVTAFEKYQSMLTGSSKPLMEYGVAITASAVNQYAWTHGIAESKKELTEQQKVLARHELFMEKTAYMQGRWNEEAETTSGRLKTNTERWDEFNNKLGQVILPMLGQLLEFFEPILKVIGSLNEDQMKWVMILGMIAAGLGPVLKLLGMLKQMQIAKGIAGISGATSALGGSMTLALGPMLKVAAAIAAIVALWEGAKKVANWWWNLGTAEQQRALTDKINAAGAAKSAEWAQNSFNPSNWFAGGTSYAPGGRSVVGENGPEVVDLPQGARVYPANQSKRMMGGGGGGGDTTIILQVAWEQVKDVAHLVDTAQNAERLARQGGRA